MRPMFDFEIELSCVFQNYHEIHQMYQMLILIPKIKMDYHPNPNQNIQNFTILNRLQFFTLKCFLWFWEEHKQGFPDRIWMSWIHGPTIFKKNGVKSQYLISDKILFESSAWYRSPTKIVIKFNRYLHSWQCSFEGANEHYWI